jgi:hypothetical protein
MSRTLRRGGWGNPLYQHMSYWDIPQDEVEDPRYRGWQYSKVYSDHWTCSPPAAAKKINNRKRTKFPSLWEP